MVCLTFCLILLRVGARADVGVDAQQTTLETLVARSAMPHFCAAPPVPLKQGFIAAPERFGPQRHGRPFRSPTAPGIAARQLADTVRVIAVLVDFDDQPMDSTRAYFVRVVEHQNQYWNQVSEGQLTIAATVTDSVYRLPQSMAYYGDDEQFGERQTFFVRDGILAADDDIDYAQYDAFYCLHAGGGQEADVRGDSPEQLWSVFVPLEAIQYFLPDSTAARGILTNDLTPTGDPFYVEMALVLPESESQDADEAGNPFTFGMLGVYAHEFGHVLGLPDLYDTTPEEFPDSQGIGSFGVMGAGTWNFNGFVPAEPCAWSRFELGFVDPVVITSDTTITLAAAEGQGDGPRAAIIPLGGDEYFLIENRLQDPDGDGEFDFHDADNDSIFTLYDLTAPIDSTDSYLGVEFDYFLPGEGTGSGLMIWHIDHSVIEAYAPLNAVQHDPEHKGVDLEEADGIEDLDAFATTLENFGSADDAFRAGHADSFGPGTIPNTHSSYGAPSFIDIRHISAAPDSLMSFEVVFRDSGDLPRRKAGWRPLELAGPIQGNHPVVADLVESWPGLECALVDSLGNVYVVDATGGSPYPGGDAAVPIGNVGPDAATTPAVGDLNGDGNLDLVIAGRDGRVFAWDGATADELLDGDGDPATDGVWAVLEGEFAGTVPVLGDVGRPGSPGRMTVFVGSRADSASGLGRLYWLVQTGGAVTVEYAELPGDLLAPPLLFTGADVAGPSMHWLVVASVTEGDATRFYEVWPELDGGTLIELPRDRRSLQNAVCSLVAGDLDGDQIVELVASDNHGRIEVYHYARRAPAVLEEVLTEDLRLDGADGWPFELGLGVAHDVSLADVDRDGRIEVLVSAFDGRLYALNFNGTPQRGFPLLVGDAVRPIPALVPAPLAMQLAGDAAPEIVAAAGDGRLLAARGDGTWWKEWTVPGPAGGGPTPIVADLDGDGVLDALVPSDLDGRAVLMAYELSGEVEPAPAWPAFRGGPTRRGLLVTGGGEPDITRSLLSEFYVYPNPVEGGTAHIHFSLGQDASVELEVMDVTGRVIARPRASDPAPGLTEHVVAWSVANEPSGVYLLRIDVESAGRRESQLYSFAVVR